MIISIEYFYWLAGVLLLITAGMILTAETPDGKLTLLAPGGDVAPGSKIS